METGLITSCNPTLGNSCFEFSKAHLCVPASILILAKKQSEAEDDLHITFKPLQFFKN